MFAELLAFLLGKIVFFVSGIGNNSFPKPLDAEQEKHYLELARQGDENARETLINHNLRLVAHIAKKYKDADNTDDLISVGSIGLIKAINTYDETKGTQLATYTARCIENEILMLLRANKKHRNNVSLSDTVGTDKDGNELTLIDLLSESDDTVFADATGRIENEKFIEFLRASLTEREFKILAMRYGLQGRTALTQREVAALLRISRSYISRIEKRAIEKMRVVIKQQNYYFD